MILTAASCAWQKEHLCGEEVYWWKFCESASHVAVTCEICFQNWLPWHGTHRGLLAQNSLEEFKNRKPRSHPPYCTLSAPENIFPPPYFLSLPQGPDPYHLEFWVSFVNCWESWVWQKCCALYSSSDITTITFICIQHSCYFTHDSKRQLVATSNLKCTEVKSKQKPVVGLFFKPLLGTKKKKKKRNLHSVCVCTHFSGTYRRSTAWNQTDYYALQRSSALGRIGGAGKMLVLLLAPLLAVAGAHGQLFDWRQYHDNFDIAHVYFHMYALTRKYSYPLVSLEDWF